MKFLLASTCISLTILALAHSQELEMEDNDIGQFWPMGHQDAVDTDAHSRSKRAVELRTLRQLMNNIAFSEYYRLRGLQLLGNLGMGHGRPGGFPANPLGATQSNSLNTISVPTSALLQAMASSPAASVAAPSRSMSGGGSGNDKELFSFPLRSDEFQRFFGTLARSRTGRRG